MAADPPGAPTDSLPSPQAPNGAARTDGRSARSLRTRRAVVDALLELLREGSAQPTARTIAQRAGVSLRSVYVHFEDLEDLFVAASEAHQDALMERWVLVDPALPLPERLDAFVSQRASVLESSAGIRRAALRNEPNSPTLQRVFAKARVDGRAEMAAVFARELAGHDDADRNDLLLACEASAGGEAWEFLRARAGLEPEAARAVMTRMLRALLEPAC